MAGRPTFSVKVDEDVQNQFREYVRESKGKIRGELGRELENAMIEYMDNDRTARLESKLDEVLARLPEETGTHTHTTNESLAKVEQIANELQGCEQQVADDTLVQADDVRRAIETVAGTDDRTVEKYRRQLKRQGFAYEHPSNSPVWTLDRPTWIGWADSYLANNPGLDIFDVIEEYPLDHDEYIDAVESLEVAVHA